MAKIEDFCKNLTDSEWEALSAEMAAINRDEQKEQAFNDKYGFKSTSIRAYEVQHYIELEKRDKMLADLRAELTGSSEQSVKASFPEFRPIKEKRVKATFYATQESLDLFNKAVDEAVERYCMTRYQAAALVLEAATKRLGIESSDAEKH